MCSVLSPLKYSNCFNINLRKLISKPWIRTCSHGSRGAREHISNPRDLMHMLQLVQHLLFVTAASPMRPPWLFITQSPAASDPPQAPLLERHTCSHNHTNIWPVTSLRVMLVELHQPTKSTFSAFYFIKTSFHKSEQSLILPKIFIVIVHKWKIIILLFILIILYAHYKRFNTVQEANC